MCRCLAFDNRHWSGTDEVCHSGTESPLLALEQISRALETLSGEKLQVEHIFSCEIVPIKQVSRRCLSACSSCS